MLSFIELMSDLEPKWQSKDLLVLFYEDSDYSFAVQEFLTNYYSDQESEYSFKSRIHGRCGYIRQAFPFLIKDYDFTKISLVLDGPNSQLSDIDFYDAIRSAIKKTDTLSYDLHQGYYRRNPFITLF